jgi:hypothetical protein
MIEHTAFKRFIDEGNVPPIDLIEQWKTALQHQLNVVHEMQALALKRLRVKCTHCGKSHQIGKLTYIQTQWYVTPHGCNGGDYWQNGEGQFNCLSCGARQREYHHPKIKDLSHSFATIVTQQNRG